MERKQLLEQIDLAFPEYLQLWKDICNIESPSADRVGVNLVADHIAAFCKGKGYAVTRQPTPAGGDMLLIELPGKSDKAPVALMAHMDTVHQKGAFGDPPVTEKDGILYGPGVVDCKGGIAVALLAMEALKACGEEHPPIRFILNADEEDGTYGKQPAVDFIKESARGCAAAFNCESGRAGLLVVGRKGIFRACVTVTGKASHAGNAYFSGVSAVREAAHKILALEACSEENGITLNCGVIQGGTVSNVVPEHCSFLVDVRFRSDEQEQRAIACLNEIVGRSYVPGSSSTWEVRKRRPAMENTPANRKLFELVAKNAADLGLDPLEATESGGGSDSAYTVAVGVPTVCTFGPTGRFIHSVKEQADIASLAERAKLLAVSVLSV